MIECYGHAQMQKLDGFSDRVFMMDMKDSNLTDSFFEPFLKLKVLDLRNNNLKAVKGLSALAE